MMKAPLHAFLAICAIAGAVFGQAPSFPTSLGEFRFAADRLGPGTVTLVPESGGPDVPYPTIRAAVKAAEEGDTVLLSDGYFRGPGNRGIFIDDKNLRLESENGPSRCIIDGQYLERILMFQGSTVTPSTLVRGITFFRGGGGVGSGIYAALGSLPTIEACIVAECAGANGAGIYYPAPGTGPQGVVRDCVFYRNQSNGDGGAFWGGNVLLERCVFIQNEASIFGGAIRAAATEMRDCLMVGNTGKAGGAVSMGASTLLNCTIVGNHATVDAGGVLFTSESIIENCILWNNSAASKGQQGGQACFFGCPDGVLSYCAVEGGTSGIEGGAGTNPQLISPVLDDPLFIDPTNLDYRLSGLSPCIDAGDPSFVAAVNEGDCENQPRINGGRVDIGADEVWGDFTLSLVAPGRAGEDNFVDTTGAKLGDLVHFFWGSTPGRSALPFGACPDLVLEMDSALLMGVVPAGPRAGARYSQFVPPFMGGQPVFMQAVGFDPIDVGAGCRVSNLVQFCYP